MEVLSQEINDQSSRREAASVWCRRRGNHPQMQHGEWSGKQPYDSGTGLTCRGSDQARAKMRAKHALLALT